MPTCKRLLLILLTSLCALAANTTYAEDEEAVTIGNNERDFVEQYRDNGFVYAVKVTPEKGVSYYLVRADGTQGDFIRTDQPDMLVPSWPILSW